MEIKVFKQFKYKGCPIIIRKLGDWTFEYLLVYKGKFYGTCIKDKLKPWQFYKWFMENPHSATQESAMIHFLTKAAETTIETLIHERKHRHKTN